VAADDLDELQRAAAEVQHGAVGERRGVDGGEVAVAGLLLAGEHAHVELRQRFHAREELRLVGGVADRARRDRLDVGDLEPARGAKVGEHLDRLQRPLHRLAPELTGRAEALRDPHRLVDLVGALPPSVGGREDDQAKRVRAQVDYRCAVLSHGAAA